MTRRAPPLPTDDLAELLPGLEGVSVTLGPIGDHTGELWDEERAGIARSREKRAREYAAGRHLARRAMANLGLPPGPVLRAEDRSPVWPAGMLGSISHAGDVAAAAVAPAGTLRGLGIDLELADRLTPRLYRRVFTPSERQWIDAADPQLASLMFTAKEAGYKAVHPSAGRYIGFHEAEVLVDAERRELRLKYLGEHGPNRIMEEGVGRFCFFERYVLTVFMIP